MQIIIIYNQTLAITTTMYIVKLIDRGTKVTSQHIKHKPT